MVFGRPQVQAGGTKGSLDDTSVESIPSQPSIAIARRCRTISPGDQLHGSANALRVQGSDLLMIKAYGPTLARAASVARPYQVGLLIPSSTRFQFSKNRRLSRPTSITSRVEPPRCFE